MKLLRITTILAIAAPVAAFAGTDFQPQFTQACFNEIAPFASKTASSEGTAVAQLKAATDLFRQTASAAEKAQDCFRVAMTDAEKAKLPATDARFAEIRQGLKFTEQVFSGAENHLSKAKDTLTASIAADIAPAAGGNMTSADPAMADAQAAMADALSAFDLGPEMFDRQLRLEQRLEKNR